MVYKKWAVVLFYTICIFIFTPYLPRLIQIASSRWSKSGLARFVLAVEIAIALSTLLMAFKFLISRKKKSALFITFLGIIFLLSFALYKLLPNPYEFTHLPEYAVLSVLIAWALEKKGIRNFNAEKEIEAKRPLIKNLYFLSGMITGITGIIDEIYQHFLPNRFFTVYDIFLNILGGILGLLVFWGIKR